MSGWRTVIAVIKHSPRSDAAVLAVTFILTVGFDLVDGENFLPNIDAAIDEAMKRA